MRSPGDAAAAYLRPEASAEIRRQIAAAGGNEVFFQGRLEKESGKVARVRVLSRGNQGMTPAVTGRLRPGDAVIHNHPSGNLTPSQADLQIASLLGANDIAFFIVDNRCERLYAVVEAHQPEAGKLLPADLVDRYFRPGGLLQDSLPSYESRPEQAALAEAVIRAFNRPGFLLAEAGTGVGKSLAYLIPAALWALANRTRVVVSTNTINLQEQLLQKDLPLLIEDLKLPLRAALIKGRSNYLCRRRVRELAAELETAGEVDEELRSLVEWARTTSDGSRADLSQPPSAAAWELVASESDACGVSRCPEFGSCFFYRARREAARAQLLIVNHHLLMADLQFPSEYGVLPEYEALVLDEVHHLEDVATGYLGENVSQVGLLMQLNRLAHRRRINLGLLRRLRRRLNAEPPGAGKNPGFREELLGLVENEVEAVVLMLLGELDDFWERLRRVLAESVVDKDGLSEEGAFRLRITARQRESRAWREEVAGVVGELLEEIGKVTRALATLVRRVEIGVEEKILGGEFFPSWINEGRAALNRLQAQADFLTRFFLAEKVEPGLIAWIEAGTGRRRNLKMVLAPLLVGGLLKDMLYERLRTLVMVSATIAVANRFDFFVSRVGLETQLAAGNLATLILKSPFDYRRNALMLVPADLPLPNDRNFIAALSLFLDTLVSRVGGRSLVLFTAYRAMRQVATLCRDSLARRGLRLLLQGEGQRPWLLHELKNNFNTVLFATDSFWEGVDVKGRALECLVIVRLPFKVPSDPVLMARLEYVESTGGNPFYDYSLPQTALKLKQGVGRLIRSRSDRGVIVVCDRRLVEKSYGARLRASLPDCDLIVSPGGELVARAAKFLALAAAGENPR